MLAARTERPSAPFIVGCGRSGTTLLRLMLDAHPQLAIPPETGFYDDVLAIDQRDPGWRDALFRAVTGAPQWRDFHLDAGAYRTALASAATVADGVRAFYRAYVHAHGKPHWGNKTPNHVARLTAIARLLPEARFVHIIRDGRDVAASLRDAWFGAGSYAACMRTWVDAVHAARDRPAETPYLEVRYERLVEAPEPTLRAICAFAGYPYRSEMLRYAESARARLDELQDLVLPDGTTIERATRLALHPRAASPPLSERIGRWRSEMPPDDVAACEVVGGALLAELGYR